MPKPYELTDEQRAARDAANLNLLQLQLDSCRYELRKAENKLSINSAGFAYSATLSVACAAAAVIQFFN